MKPEAAGAAHAAHRCASGRWKEKSGHTLEGAKRCSVRTFPVGVSNKLESPRLTLTEDRNFTDENRTRPAAGVRSSGTWGELAHARRRPDLTGFCWIASAAAESVRLDQIGQGRKRGRISSEMSAVAASRKGPDDHGVAGERQQLVTGN